MDKTSARRRTAATLAALLFLGSGTAFAESTEAAAETRWSQTTQMSQAARQRGEGGKVSQDEFPAFSAQAANPATKSIREQTKSAAAAATAVNLDFWFYTADVVLFNDNDQDGYFHGIDLLFDADTIYNFAEVYAVVYLSLEGGPWNEYAVTDNFTISGASSDDEYVVVTELVSGYPAGSYDLLIELFDTFDDSFVASYGPADTSELAFLQLEDAGRDVLPGTTVIVREGGGGALSWLMLMPLLFAVRRARIRRSA